MKNSILFLIVISALTSAKAQQTADTYFEGVVTYSVTYEGNSYYSDQLKQVLGTESNVYYYKGNTIQTTNGIMGSEAVLIPSENRYYLLPYLKDTITWIETNSKDSIIDYQILPDSAEIMGVKCAILEIRTIDTEGRETLSSYYYNKTFFTY